MTFSSQFEIYARKIVRAENAGNYGRIAALIKKAAQLTSLDSYEKWRLKYWENILHFLYYNDWEWDDMCADMLSLREQARILAEGAIDGILEQYMSLLYHFLSLQLTAPKELLKYESIAKEFYDLTTKYDFSVGADEDLMSFSNIVMGTICYLKGQVILQEQYLEEVYHHYRGKRILTVYAILGIYELSNAKLLLGKREEAVEILFYLFGLFLDDAVEIPIDDYEQAKNCMQELLQNIVLSIADSFSWGGAYEEMIYMLTICLFQTDLVQHDKKNDSLWRLYVLYLQGMHILGQKIPLDILDTIRSVMSEVTEEQMYMELTCQNVAQYYLGCYFLAKALDQEDAVHYADAAMKITLTENTPERERILYLSRISAALRIYRVEEMEMKAIECAKNVLAKLIRFYSLAELDADNDNLEKYISICNDGFMMAYAAIENVVSVIQRLEYRMNYKNMLGAIIRLRNKVCDHPGRVKAADEFPFYTYRQLCDALPPDSVLLDFYYSNSGVMQDPVERTVYYEHAGLEVIAVKKSDRMAVRNLRIPDAGYLNERIVKFMHIIQSGSSKYHKVGEEIYSSVLAAFSDLFEGAVHIYISPDYILYNLPFDLVLESGGIDTYRELIYISSIRNLFERTKENPVEGQYCIVGAPSYEINDHLEERLLQEERGEREAKLQALPYSKYEVMKIAVNTESSCYMGEKATKYIIRPGYRCIHIATHGLVPNEYSNPWYESNLAFSGAEDYLASGLETKEYGNGILSAEEISHMKLDRTEMVVLSACHSGKSTLSRFQQQTGLHIAFGAAGVKYIISALWQVDDLATVFLMSGFYQELRNGAAVPEALRRAKSRLRKITVRELIDTIESDRSLCQDIAGELLSWLESISEDRHLYAAPYYWNAFECFQYKF